MTKKKEVERSPFAKLGPAYEYYANNKKAREEAVARFFKRIEQQKKEEYIYNGYNLMTAAETEKAAEDFRRLFEEDTYSIHPFGY